MLTVVRTTTHRLHRDVVSIDRSSAAPGSRSTAPSWAGGGRAVVAEPDAPSCSTTPPAAATTSRPTPRSAAPACEPAGEGRDAVGHAPLPPRPRRRAALVVGLGLLCVLVAALALTAEPTAAGTGLASARPAG